MGTPGGKLARGRPHAGCGADGGIVSGPRRQRADTAPSGPGRPQNDQPWPGISKPAGGSPAPPAQPTTGARLPHWAPPTLTYAPGPKRTACRSKTAAGPRPTSSPSTRGQQARRAELRKGSGHPQHQRDRASPHFTRARGWVRPGSQKEFQNWGRIADRFRPLDTDTERTDGTQLCDL